MPDNKRAREHLPAIVVMALGCLLTGAGFVAAGRLAQERVALHAQADATHYQYTLQQGIDSYIHLSRDLAAHLATSGPLSEPRLAAYARAADVLGEHPGLSYIGYVERVKRADLAGFEAAARAQDPSYPVLRRAAGQRDLFPYRYAYPLDATSAQAKGLDFGAVPERWNAMQQARDSALSTATARHFYLAAARRTPIVLVFTPVYDPARPAATVDERRAALRGFVFSILEIDETIRRVMGPGFDTLFDLEIYDGPVRPENLLYDADKRPHTLRPDRGFPVARVAQVTVANRQWTLYFFPKRAYAERYRTSYPLAILLFGLSASAALALATSIWIRRMRSRSRQRADNLRFEAVFEAHPSAVYSLDRQRRFVNANTRALAEFKIAKADLVGKPIDELVVPENRERARACFADVLDGNSVSYESAFIDGTGARVEVSVIMLPLMVDGAVGSVLGIAQNITERKMNEWRLKESRQMLQLVINHIPQRVFWKDTSLAYLGCNEPFARDAGLARPEEIIGKTDFDLAWRANAQDYRKDDLETMSQNRPNINYEESQLRDDGSERWLRTSKIPLADIEGRTVALLGMYEDITERKALERQLEEMAHYDSLTGLANRALFHEQLELAMLRVRRRGSVAALLYLDLDKFKEINDGYGHDVGDRLLKAFAQRIKDVVRDTDMAARLGGDEFAVLLEDLSDRADAAGVAGKLVAAMREPFRIDDAELAAGTSIGVAILEPGVAGDEVVRRADQAMYRAKRGGRNRYEVDATPA